MTRVAQPTRSFFVVEGEGDKFILRRHIDRTASKLLPVSGRKAVKATIRTAREKKIPGMVGLIDRDFDHHLGRLKREEAIIHTDENDLDLVLVASPAIRQLAREWTVRLVAPGGSETVKPLLDAVVEAASRVGTLRLVSHEQHWALRFRGLNFREHFLAETMQIDMESLAEEVVGASGEGAPPLDEVLRAFRERDVDRKTGRHLDYCQGHDVLELLQLALEQLDLDGGTPSNTGLPRQFATAFSRRDFEATRIAKELRSWESLGHAFRVLPREGDEAPAH